MELFAEQLPLVIGIIKIERAVDIGIAGNVRLPGDFFNPLKDVSRSFRERALDIMASVVYTGNIYFQRGGSKGETYNAAGSIGDF